MLLVSHFPRTLLKNRLLLHRLFKMETLENLGLTDHVAVYVPQSYNFAGNVMLFPKEAVTPLSIESSQAMAFIVSGGVSKGSS